MQAKIFGSVVLLARGWNTEQNIARQCARVQAAKKNSTLLSFQNSTTVEMPKIVKSVTSSDGLKLYADSNDNVGKTPIVFVHGFRLSGFVFNPIFESGAFSSRFHLVCS